MDCKIVNIDRCSLNDGPGIRTVVFFKGCPLRCCWCHNPETYNFDIEYYTDSESNKKTYGQVIDIEKIKEIIIKDIEYYKASNGGVTFSGGEALYQYKAVLELLKFCKASNINTAIETSGYIDKSILEICADYVDIWLYDYKLTNKDDYIKYISKPCEKIFENLEYLITKKAEIILRCPIIPNINDNKKHFEAISKISKNVKSVEILPYHNLGKQKALNLKIQNYYLNKNANDVDKTRYRNLLKENQCLNYRIL